jgi:molecular chaperone HtpG
LEKNTIDALLKKYCRFMPIPVISGKQQEWKDGKYVDTDKDNVINTTEPLWARKPTELKDEDYLKFYHEIMPGLEDPMFWIHLNVDYPFTLTGILYFPKIKNNIDIQKNRIQLYCNQVYVTDQVEGVVPEFMTLMQGIIDSPDIPLNVSRSYLQSDREVKKISSYISKKVAEKLEKMFSSDRKNFENKWDDIKIFIEYGMLTDEKFYEAATKFFLYKDSDGNYFTAEEYNNLVTSNQTDRHDTVIYLYTSDLTAQYSYIEAAKNKGYNVLVMDGQLDGHLISMLENKLEKKRFVRVDSDTIDKLIEKEENKDTSLSPLQIDILTTLFKKALPDADGTQYIVTFNQLTATDAPAIITQNEFMRRMKDMAAMQPGGGFYGSLPDSYNLVINTARPAVKRIIDNATSALSNKIKPIKEQIDSINNEISEIRKGTDAEKEKTINEKEKQVDDLRSQEEEIISGYDKESRTTKQIVALALLQSNLLKGEQLTEFIHRSAELLDL